MSKPKYTFRSIRFYDIGFAFFWVISFLGTSSWSESQFVENAFEISRTTLTVLFLFLLAFLIFTNKELQNEKVTCFLPFLLLTLGAFLLVFFQNNFQVAIVAGCLEGIAGASYMAFWQEYYARCNPGKIALAIPTSAAISSLLIIAIQTLLLNDIEILALCAALTFLSSVCLYIARRDVTPQRHVHFGNQELRTLTQQLWKPIFCVCAVGFAWQLMANLNPSNRIFIAVNWGIIIGSLLVIVTELLMTWEIEKIFQILFPIVTSAFLLVAIFGLSFTPLASGILMTGFEILNLLLIMLAAAYANQHHEPPIYVYVLCITPTLVIMEIGRTIGKIAAQAFVQDVQSVVAVLFLGVYVLSLGLYAASKSKKNPSSEIRTQTHFNEDGLLPNSTQEMQPLTPREREIAELILSGNNVPAIAKELVISENTVRGHMKNIYQKLGVHSRQQLIDLVSKSERH